MLKNDPFSQWLGIEILAVHEGNCRLQCTISDEMLNGYKITHGGILFSLADSATAFASSTYGRLAYSIDQSISFINKSFSGDKLLVTATSVYMGFKTGVINVEINNSKDERIAVTKSTVYRTNEYFKL